MKKSYYIHSGKISSRIADSVIPGNHITVEGITYQKLTKRPLGRSAVRNLVNIDSTEKLILF
jgi:chorismate-pyruvate lyase